MRRKAMDLDHKGNIWFTMGDQCVRMDKISNMFLCQYEIHISNLSYKREIRSK